MTLVHMVWLGEGMDFSAVERAVNAGGEVRLYTDDEVLMPQWRWAYDTLATVPQMKSDLLRLSALRRYGGLYLDFDVLIRKDIDEIVKGWDGFVVPTMCHTLFKPGDIQYCPADWPHWDRIDAFIAACSDEKPPYLLFTHVMFDTMFDIVHPIDDCDRFPTSQDVATDNAVVWRGFASTKHGPGTKLKALLAKIGIVPAPGCACLKRAAHMDAMGSDWCGKNIDQIVGWLRDEHKKTKTVLPFIDAVARSIVRLAVRLSRDTER